MAMPNISANVEECENNDCPGCPGCLAADDGITCLPNITRAAFCEQVLGLCRRFEIPYDPQEDQLFHCCEAIAICLFMDGERASSHGVLVTFLHNRGIIRFRGE